LYNELWKIFFEDIPANLKGQTQSDIDRMKNEFMQGGYYRYTHVNNPRMANIVINANYWSSNVKYFQEPGEEA